MRTCTTTSVNCCHPIRDFCVYRIGIDLDFLSCANQLRDSPSWNADVIAYRESTKPLTSLLLCHISIWSVLLCLIKASKAEGSKDNTALCHDRIRGHVPVVVVYIRLKEGPCTSIAIDVEMVILFVRV